MPTTTKKSFIKRTLRKLRHSLEYVIGFPISILLFIIFPFYKIKLVKLFSDRIGHYALNTELMLCTLDQNPPNNNEKYFFFTCSSSAPICNSQLHLMWKRTIPILPFPDLISKIDKILGFLLGAKYKKDRIKSTFEPTWGVNDIHGLLEKSNQPHLVFNYEEKNNLKWFNRKDHAAYLGKELKKAEIALILGTEYYQE